MKADPHAPVPATAALQRVRLLHQRPGRLRFAAPPPLALYIHLPWCLQKCPYCDFNSHALKPDAADPAAMRRLERRYVDALIADLDASLPLVWGRPVVSVFVGGGTPSLFAPEAIDRLLAAVRARLPLEPACEVTLEANPGTFERDRFRDFRGAGVTRLSIGVQSFDDAQLARLGRVHDRAQAVAAIEEAQRSFETFNIDLMYALPQQTLEALDAELAQALAFAPPHLSVYHLTMEPNTVFATRPPAGLPDDDLAAEMLDRITERTQAAGLGRYEVSAYARPGHACRHNLNYWRFGDYLGIGAGAHGKLSFAERVLRQVRFREPAAYMAQALQAEGSTAALATAEAPQGLPAVSNDHEVAADDLPFEFMLNALRLREGFPLPLFAERTGLPVTEVLAQIEAAEARGLLERSGQQVRPTARGFDFLSDLQAMFLR